MLTPSCSPGLSLKVTFSGMSSLNLLLATPRTGQGPHTVLSHLHFSFETFCEGRSRSDSFPGVSSVPRTAPGSQQVPHVPLPDERRNKVSQEVQVKKETDVDSIKTLCNIEPRPTWAAVKLAASKVLAMESGDTNPTLLPSGPVNFHDTNASSNLWLPPAFIFLPSGSSSGKRDLNGSLKRRI